MRRRSPFGQRPWVRAMLVFAQTSLMTINLFRSRSGCASNRPGIFSGYQTSFARLQGQSFLRQGMTDQEPLHRSIARRQAIAPQGGLMFIDGSIRRLFDETQNVPCMLLDMPRATITAKGFGCCTVNIANPRANG